MSVNGYIILKKSLLCKPLTCINNFFTANITLFLNRNMRVSSTRRKDRKTIGTTLIRKTLHGIMRKQSNQNTREKNFPR